MSLDNRIPTTHVGSLVRPPELLRYITAIEQGVAVDRAASDAQLRRSVGEIVARQQAAGIDIVSDGEFGKFRTWSAYVLERLGNIEEQEIDEATGAGRDRSLFPEFYAEYFPSQHLPRCGIPIATGPIVYRGQAAIAHDIEVFRSALAGQPDLLGFVPLVAPASAMPRFRLGYYDSEEEFLFALAEALRQEYRAVIDAGLLLQVDDAFLPYMYDVAFADRPLDDYRRWAEVRVAALNHALAGLPPERIRYHICWGSFATPHVGDIELRHIVDLVLRVDAGAYCMEMANPRHEHEWRLWQNVKLPEGKKLIPGVVSHATNIVEHPELVAERLVRLARLVGRDNVMAGTDCGFAQATHVRRVHPSIQWAKLEALAAGARLATQQLWGRA